ncbi:MAG: hypothetical protein M3Q10_07010, partial [Chloroflexota bacterium]|nr:hypothetical protein [Chloroflexota bacterium]
VSQRSRQAGQRRGAGRPGRDASAVAGEAVRGAPQSSQHGSRSGTAVIGTSNGGPGGPSRRQAAMS